MSEQHTPEPVALIHAKWLERSLTIGAVEAAAELRRLHTIENQHEELLLEANQCRLDLVGQIHELADHIERAMGCISDQDMLEQIDGQRKFAIRMAGKWNQNGNPFNAIASVKDNTQ